MGRYVIDGVGYSVSHVLGVRDEEDSDHARACCGGCLSVGYSQCHQADAEEEEDGLGGYHM